MIVNTGRAGGIIDVVEVLRPNGEVVEAVECEGFPQGAFRPLALPAMASMRIIIQTPPDQSFPDGVRLAVGTGSGRPREITPTPTAPNVGLFGLTSVLPPSTTC